jgi:hypothetical protein
MLPRNTGVMEEWTPVSVATSPKKVVEDAIHLGCQKSA